MVIGVWSARKIRTASSFFISERNFGKTMMTFFNFGTGTNTDQAVTVVSKTYVSGASGIWYQWLWLFATPFYWLLAPLFRRMRAVTTADYLFKRYDQSVAVLFALVGMAQLSVNIGVSLRASECTYYSGNRWSDQHCSCNICTDRPVCILRCARWIESSDNHRFHSGHFNLRALIYDSAICFKCSGRTGLIKDYCQ